VEKKLKSLSLQIQDEDVVSLWLLFLKCINPHQC